MAAQKISDLSVGDWVRYNGKEYTIASIYMAAEGYPHEAELTYQGISCGCVYIGHLQPIPITAEILEKNGFKRSTSQFIVYHTDKVWISYDKPSETWSVTMYINDNTSNLHANILHIHELQHALRLAGVDKEINL